MFKACFGNYWRNLKYTFIELGFMYLALMFGFDVFFKKLGFGFEQFKEAFMQMMETQNTDLFIEGLKEIANGFLHGAIWFFAMQLIGILLGYIVIMLMARTDIERRNIFKVLWGALLDAVVLAVVVMITTLLLKVASWGGILAIILFFPLYSLGTLFGSYFNHGIRHVKFGNAVSIKNVIKLTLCNILIVAISVGVGLLCLLVFNVIISIMMTIGLTVVALVTISLNADSYVNRVLAAAKEHEKIADIIEKARYGTGEQPKVEEKIEEPKEEQSKVEDIKEEKEPKVINDNSFEHIKR